MEVRQWKANFYFSFPLKFDGVSIVTKDFLDFGLNTKFWKNVNKFWGREKGLEIPVLTFSGIFQNPTMDPLHYGLSLYRRRRFDKCIELCNKEIENNPKNQAS